jgi:uncharacterized protein (DUF1330 family)
VPDEGQFQEEENPMLKSALLVTAGIAIGVGANAVLAQSSAPYYEVAEINVIDQPNYEASGVVPLRDQIKASGAKLIAGGYNKAIAYEGSNPANRYLIFQYPDKATHDKVYANDIKPWMEKVKGKYVNEFRTIGVEAVEQK